MADTIHYVINTDGEIINELKEGDRILKAETSEYLQETTEINHDEAFVKFYTKPMFTLSKKLNGGESLLLTYLIQYINYNDGLLKHTNGKILTRHCISKETGLHVTQVDKYVIGLIKEEIIGKHKTGRSICFTVNPFIFMKGKRINKTLYELFKNTKWARMYNEE